MKKKDGTNITLGNNIRIFRKQKGWTQIDLAEKLNCSQAIITAYETNVRKPPADKITLLSELFNVSVNKLFGEAPAKKNEKPKNPKLWKKFEQVEKLPAADKRAIFKMIDGFLKK